MRWFAAAFWFWASSVAAMAGPAADDLIRLVEVEAWMQIAREEGLDNAQTINADMLGGQGGAIWAAQVSSVYDVARMTETARPAFEAMDEAAVLRINAYLASDQGRRATQMELGARRTMRDPAAEAAARAAFEDLKRTDDPRLMAVKRLVDAGDLIERNVSAALNDTYVYYRALAEGGGIEMTEEEMIAEVYSQEETFRADTESWLMGYLLLLLGTLGDDEADTYVRFYETAEGQMLTAAVFEGFGATYRDVSHAMGQVLALNLQQMRDGQSDL